MKILIIDFFNLIKRYTFLIDEDLPDEGEFYSDTTTKIINKILNTITENHIDLLIVCSDSGFNYRANSLLGGQYKATRNRAKSLTVQEKENDYIEKLKNIIQALPCMFFEVKDVEADNIVYFVTNYFKQKVENVDFLIATSDTDFLQLLDTDTSILNWSKGIVNINNWKDIHKLDCKYLKPKDYAILKSIVGDASDNIKGIKGFGWKTVLKVLSFLYEKLDKDLVIDNISNILAYFEEIQNNFELDKKEKIFVKKYYDLISQNKEQISINQSIISLDLLETPFVSKIMTNIEKTLLNDQIKFNSTEFLKLIRFSDRYKMDEDYSDIKTKNLKSLYTFKTLAVRSEKMRRALAQLID